MTAGHSAADEAARQRAIADQADFISRKAREMARRYPVAADTEAQLGSMLEPLEELGYHVLADRIWPGSVRAQVDFVLVGPSGVYIVDAKSWADVHVQNDHVYQGQDDVTERVENLSGLASHTQAALADIGLPAGEVRTVAVFMNKRHLRGRVHGVDLVGVDGALNYLIGRGIRLQPDQIEAALAATKALFPPHATSPHTTLQLPTELTFSAPVVPISRREALISLEELEEALLSSILAAPIEEWMAFLHPDQARLVCRSFNGPSRIRGAAGTGKTVVGLHRAAYIARTRPGTVLVTTFVKTLPAVLSSLLDRMAHEVSGRVQFEGVYGFALGVLRSRGVPFQLEPRIADRLFEKVWRARGKDHELGRLDPDMGYWKDEILSVIKGRGLTQFEEYGPLARLGRRRGLTGENRHAVWEFYTAYDAELRTAGVCDFADVILLAEQSLRNIPLEGYSAVVIDEAQDLSCAMIRMFHALVGDRPDALNLIGDGQQTIYPGGYTLSEAHISVAGRGVVMTKNYRNTVEIADFAASVVAGDEFVDIEGATSKADVPAQIMRHGSKPKVTRFATRSRHDQSLVEHVRSLLASGTRLGDIGILTHTNWAVNDVSQALTSAGLRFIELLKYDGKPVDAIKIGTIKRAKGLEFKQVLVVHTPVRLLEALPPDADSAATERRELDRRELYVAMTRARDGLWVGVA
ncbi:UvrD-helicase domain-containing protein [Glaciihabitans sp. UYNi722]|uniref:nuclease-related domain-containing DEAD/DEAH box helicase n=1 Tax=Glaciihabitans sp. UYNi722 TaxID=3156344 RepID=UPI0033908CB4